MKPIGPLMREHRLIERVVTLLAREKDSTEKTGEVRGDYIEKMADFYHMYADRTHHGKEEDILFKALAGKPLTPEHRRIIEELIQEHTQSRKLVKALADAGGRAASVNRNAVREVLDAMGGLLELYPRHIEKEDKHFFYPSMEYFNREEQDKMLEEFWEFDRNLIHEKYRQIVETLENMTGNK